jgi:hypothetical protein
MKSTRKLRGGENTRRNRIRAMIMKQYANSPSNANKGPASLRNFGSGLLSTASQKLQNLGRGATQKVKNLGQAMKNKYAQYELESKLENNFYNRPNIAGQLPGKASRNLLKVANKQQQNKKAAEERRLRNNTRRNNGWSSGNKYQAASMASSLFF